MLGQNPEMVSPGYVRFTFNGRELRLEPVYETTRRRICSSSSRIRPARTPPTRPAVSCTRRCRRTAVSSRLQSGLQPAVRVHRIRDMPAAAATESDRGRIEAGEKAYHGVTKGRDSGLGIGKHGVRRSSKLRPPVVAGHPQEANPLTRRPLERAPSSLRTFDPVDLPSSAAGSPPPSIHPRDRLAGGDTLRRGRRAPSAGRRSSPGTCGRRA